MDVSCVRVWAGSRERKAVVAGATVTTEYVVPSKAVTSNKATNRRRGDNPRLALAGGVRVLVTVLISAAC